MTTNLWFTVFGEFLWKHLQQKLALSAGCGVKRLAT
jgi:hypothetical protein